MADSSIHVRMPLPGSNDGSEGATLNLGDFHCEQLKLISDDGGSGLVYEGISPDYYGHTDAAPAHLIVKECYPMDVRTQLHRQANCLVMEEEAPLDIQERFTRHLDRFRSAFVTQTQFYESSIRELVTPPSRAYLVNGTAYTVSDSSHGEVLTDAIDRMTLLDRLGVLEKLCDAIGGIHDQGYLYLDLKPSNVLAIKNPGGSAQDEFTGAIKLFDFDTVVKIEDVESMGVASGSQGWSAYEQLHPARKVPLGRYSDIYALGSILFWMLIGRPPSSSEIIHANGHWEITRDDLPQDMEEQFNDRAITLMNEIFQRTLTIEVGDRYSNAADMKRALVNLSDELAPMNKAAAVAIDEMRKNVEEITDQNRATEKKHRRFMLIAAAALVVVAAIAFFSSSSFRMANDPVLGRWDLYQVSYGDAMEDASGVGYLEFNKDGTATFMVGGEVTDTYKWENNSDKNTDVILPAGRNYYVLTSQQDKFRYEFLAERELVDGFRTGTMVMEALVGNVDYDEIMFWHFGRED